MKRIDFDCTFDLAEEIISLLDKINEDYPVVSVYGGYDVIKYLLEDLIMSGVAISESIELESYVIDHYDKEFVLYLTEDGVSVCKCWKYNGYLNGSGDISFVHEDCNSKLLSHIDSQTICEFGICSDGEEDCDCEECCGCCECGDNKELDVKSDDDGYSITVRCNLDADEAMEMIKDMENRMERMNDMFREMDYFRRLLKF